MTDVTINGVLQQLPEATTILEALNQIGIEVPALCSDARARPGGDCRLCSVRVAGEPHLVAACTRKLEPGMIIETHTPDIESFRRTTLNFLATHCSEQSFNALPEKPLHQWLARYNVEPALDRDGGARAMDDSNPYFRFDEAQCIACYRCVRVCEDLQGQFVWHFVGRGDVSRLVVDKGCQLSESSCVSCGACIDACPSAALVDKRRLELGSPSNWTRTTCSYCGVGCELRVGTKDGRIVEVRPEMHSPVSKGHLCSKGRYAWDFGASPDRITQPMVRVDGEWRPTSWEHALDTAAGELMRIREKFGPDSIGVLGSARATNEENYLIQKLARAVLGTNNVDCCARVCHAPTAAAMKHMLGTGAATNSFDDIERAKTLLIAGANPTECHPIVGARIKQQVRRGARLIVIDPRRIELAEYAHVHLAPKPGTNIPLLHAIAHAIIAENLADREFLSNRVDGVGDFQKIIARYPPEHAAQVCGVRAEDIRKAARIYAQEKPAMCFHGLGMTEHLQGTEGVMALVNLALLTGNIGKPGSGINPLRGQNNVQGAAVMGCEPAGLTGGATLEQGRARFETVWRMPIPSSRGLDLMQMIDAAASGDLKAMYVVGYDILMTLAKTADVRRALARLDCVIVQDFVMNETAREFGTVFVPAATAFEKDGTFMNSERRIQRVRKAIDAPGMARPDSWIVAELAARLGARSGFEYATAEGIWDEVRQVWPAVAGISYARIEQAGLQWPCPTQDHPGTPVLHARGFAGRTRASLECIEFVPTLERIDEDFPLLLTTGRNLYQFNAGTMTGRTDNKVLRPSDMLDVSPDDASALHLDDGTTVRVVSRHGSVMLPARIDARMRPGQLFATFHDPRNFVNLVTGEVRDRRVHAPEYKVTAVRIERIANPSLPESG